MHDSKLQSMSNSLLTQELLRKITRRLSGREDCKGVEYCLGIGVHVEGSPINLSDENSVEDYIFFSPDVYVYRDKKHRKSKDLFRIVDFILYKYYEEDLVKGRDSKGQLLVDTSKLVKGLYRYQISIDGRRRKWICYNSLLR